MAIQTPDGLLKLISYLGVRREGRLLLVRYETPPNPQKQGWWIPAPEAGYGEDPEEVGQAELARLGFGACTLQLMAVESFSVGPGNWHVVVHYVTDVAQDPDPGPGIVQWRWCSEAELPAPDEFAHKRWEHGLARQMIGFAPLR